MLVLQLLLLIGLHQPRFTPTTVYTNHGLHQSRLAPNHGLRQTTVYTNHVYTAPRFTPTTVYTKPRFTQTTFHGLHQPRITLTTAYTCLHQPPSTPTMVYTNHGLHYTKSRSRFTPNNGLHQPRIAEFGVGLRRVAWCRTLPGRASEEWHTCPFRLRGLTRVDCVQRQLFPIPERETFCLVESQEYATGTRGTLMATSWAPASRPGLQRAQEGGRGRGGPRRRRTPRSSR